MDNQVSRVIELVGPAGAGKSTLASFLVNINEKIRIIDPPFYRDPRKTFFFLRQGFSMLPEIFHVCLEDRITRLSIVEIINMAVLNGWHNYFNGKKSSYEAILLDQGPIYLMTELRLFHTGALGSYKLNKWWDKAYRNWATTLNEVIYLDTEDHLLVRRIRERKKWHVMKHEPEDEVLQFLNEFRRIYKNIFELFIAINPGLKIHYFDTGSTSVQDLAKMVSSRCTENVRMNRPFPLNN